MGNVRKRKRLARRDYALSKHRELKAYPHLTADFEAFAMVALQLETVASHSVDNDRTRQNRHKQQRLATVINNSAFLDLLNQLLNDATLARHYADLLDYAQAQDRKANADYERELLGQALWQQRETHLPPPIPKHQLRSITSLDPPTDTYNKQHRANLGYVVGLMPQNWYFPERLSA